MNAPLHPDQLRAASVTLDDKYALQSGDAFMSGVQALVRLPMLQRQRDALAGLNTADAWVAPVTYLDAIGHARAACAPSCWSCARTPASPAA